MTMSKVEVDVSSGIDEKLKALNPNLDLTQGPPINQKRTVTFVNHFIISMTDFLNKFAQSCEHKLFICDQKINKLEDELCLLEAKLNSIPEVADQNNKPVETTEKSTTSNKPAPMEDEVDKEAQSTNEEDDKKTKNLDHKEPLNPEIAKYLKMVQVGVPVQAVKLKMEQEGLDPHLLDIPEN